MQGTVLMLMALSGLGCHNKSCDVVYSPPAYSCFSGGCYANVYPPDYVSPLVLLGVLFERLQRLLFVIRGEQLRRLLLGYVRRPSWVRLPCQAL